MRIIHLVPGITHEASGPSYSVVRLCESLITHGEDITLGTLDWGSIPAHRDFFKVFPLGFGPRKLGRSPAMKHWLDDQVMGGNVDILHNHGMWQMNAIYSSWTAKKNHSQLIYSPRGSFSDWAMKHGTLAKRIFWPLLQLPALKRATLFHATSKSEYYDIRRFGFRQPVAIIPNGIDLLTPPHKTALHEKVLLFLGRIHPVKGLDFLLTAWNAIQNAFPEWRIVIVGDDKGYHKSTGYLDEIKKKASQFKLNRIEFQSPLYGDEKFRAYRDADLFVLPTYSENFGMTVAEALVMETPAIVSKGAPWSSLVDNQCGWWIDIGVEPLVIALREAMSLPRSRLRAMGQNGRQLMRREYAWDKIGHRMADTYRWLCDRSLPLPPWVRLD